MGNRLLFIVSEDTYFMSHRLHLAQHAISMGYEVGFLGNISSHKPALESAGIIVYNWNIRRGALSIFSQIKTLASLFRCIKDFRPNLVHAVAAKPILYTSISRR